MKKMDEEMIVEEILKKSNWWDRIIFKTNKKLFIKFFNSIRVQLVNSLLK